MCGVLVRDAGVTVGEGAGAGGKPNFSAESQRSSIKTASHSFEKENRCTTKKLGRHEHHGRSMAVLWYLEYCFQPCKS